MPDLLGRNEWEKRKDGYGGEKNNSFKLILSKQAFGNYSLVDIKGTTVPTFSPNSMLTLSGLWEKALVVTWRCPMKQG